MGPHRSRRRPGVRSRGESRVRPAPPSSRGYCDQHISRRTADAAATRSCCAPSSSRRVSSQTRHHAPPPPDTTHRHHQTPPHRPPAPCPRPGHAADLWAARHGQAEAARLLLEAGASVGVTGSKQANPLTLPVMLCSIAPASSSSRARAEPPWPLVDSCGGAPVPNAPALVDGATELLTCRVKGFYPFPRERGRRRARSLAIPGHAPGGRGPLEETLSRRVRELFAAHGLYDPRRSGAPGVVERARAVARPPRRRHRRRGAPVRVTREGRQMERRQAGTDEMHLA